MSWCSLDKADTALNLSLVPGELETLAALGLWPGQVMPTASTPAFYHSTPSLCTPAWQFYPTLTSL